MKIFKDILLNLHIIFCAKYDKIYNIILQIL